MKKKLFYLLTIACAMFLCLTTTSCNKTTSVEDQLVGKWWATSATVKSYTNGELSLEMTLPLEEPNIYFVFNADGSGSFGETADDSEAFTWSVSDDKVLTMTPVNPDDSEEEVSQFNIENISDTALTLSIDISYEEDGDMCRDYFSYNLKRVN